MDINELLGWLTDGLDDAEKAVVTKSVMRDSVKTKASALKAEKDFTEIVTKAAALQAELDGDPAQNKPGTRAYRDWYEKNSAAAIANDKAIRDFEAKHGAGTFQKALAGELPGAAAPIVNNETLTMDQVQKLLDDKIKSIQTGGLNEESATRLINKQFQEQLAPNIAGVLKGTGKLVQRHMFAGRKSEIDFDALDKIMGEKKFTMEQAYDEWDKPEREKIAAADMEATIQRRVNEEIQKRNAVQVPAGADATPGTLSVHKGADAFDKNSLTRDLASSWAKAETTVTQ